MLYNKHIGMIVFTTNPVFFQSLVTHFKQSTSVQYQAVSHNENQNLQFFLRSKKFCKITKN